MAKVALIVGLIALGTALYLGKSLLACDEPEVPIMPETHWGPAGRVADISVKPFTINIPKTVIQDLNERLSRRRELVPPLENAAWTFGISSTYLQTILEYWRNNYNWSKRQALLNQYPQFTTNIQGLDIHFYHVKPKNTVINGKKLRVLPMLMVHGWPGSVIEFQKIIPMLTTPQPDRDFVFEIIAPSLPGYGFSQGAVRPGLGCLETATIFKNLMDRLGFKKFYTQGGDWGSLITLSIGILYPERVFGSHSNMCAASGPKAWFWKMIGAYIPSLVIEPEHHSKMYPLKYHFSRLIEESGYFHIQATKPDTIGAALSDSPTALAAYILEKFSTWTNGEYRYREDGGLLEKFNIDELLDNVMVYWVTNSITTSVRLYAESVKPESYQRFQSLVSHVPTACAAFPNEVMYTSKAILELQYKNLTQFNHLLRGGHFAAFEEPKLLSDDVWTFVDMNEKRFYTPTSN